ncbi:prepilin-type N-terminal cleavage/methylation domain-containing protein [Ectobacillus sp. sgz5001026]|uniref:prepilin-type N-terminal cleavage/methylation domain-containing protein n=1 Tax=Ectobacillus sp. sgz5001026 TaxID=3242473 RepID=UPI0036D3B700
MHILRNEHGLTLVELLAVVVILGIVSAIAVPSIGSIIENSKRDAHIANARQMIEAARIYATNEGATTNSATLDELATKGYIDYPTDPFSSQPYTKNNENKVTWDSQIQTFSVTLYCSQSKYNIIGKSLDALLNSTSAFDGTSSTNGTTTGSTGSTTIGTVAFQNASDFTTKLVLNPNDYNPVTLNANQCTYTGNAQLQQSNFAGNVNWSPCPDTHFIQGSTYFSNGLNLYNNLSVTVDKDMYVNNSVQFAPGTATVSGNALIQQNLVLNGASKMDIGQNLYVKSNTNLTDNSLLNVSGSFRSDKGLTTYGTSAVTIGGNAFITNNTTISGTMNVKGNFQSDSSLTIDTNGAVTIGGNMEISNSLTLGNNYPLTINGNAVFTTPITIASWGHQPINVKGSVTIGNQVYTKDFVYYNSGDPYNGITFLIGH